jgi:hypothetical protein
MAAAISVIADVLSIVSFIASFWAVKEILKIKKVVINNEQNKQFGIGGTVTQTIDKSHGKK